MKGRMFWAGKEGSNPNRKELGAAMIVLAAILIAVWILVRLTGWLPWKETEDAALTGARAPGISAGAAILIDVSDGRVLYEYNADAKMYPASTTKIMTALVTLDLCTELGLGLENEILVPAEAEGVEGSSIYLKAGERVTMERLLYGLMLQSGNDAAVALAVTMGGGSEEGLARFVTRMNDTAVSLGCEGTHFVNPNGLFNEEHYTTARDLAVIARCALQYEEFRRIVAAEEWEDFANKNKTIFQYEGGDGVKIGYTTASGRTLAASATRDGVQLLAVVLNDGNWFQDAYNLLDFGFQVLGTE